MVNQEKTLSLFPQLTCPSLLSPLVLLLFCSGIMFNQYGSGLSDWFANYAVGRDPALRRTTLIENCWIHDTGSAGIKFSPGVKDVEIVNCEIGQTGRRTNSLDGPAPVC
jgi:hypothetical protein